MTHENLDLKATIRREIESISPETLSKVRRSFENRLAFCVASNGSRMAEIVFKIQELKCFIINYSPSENKISISMGLVLINP